MPPECDGGGGWRGGVPRTGSAMLWLRVEREQLGRKCPQGLLLICVSALDNKSGAPGGA